MLLRPLGLHGTTDTLVCHQQQSHICACAVQGGIFHENDNLFIFSDQLQELRKVTLGGIICANMEDVISVQPDVFLNSDPYL
jgi:hypothetical protein